MVKQSPRQRHAKAVTPAVRSVGATKRNTAAAPPAAPAGGAGKPKRPPTDFEQRLYDLCKCIPAGRVATYGSMAQVLGSAPRACGQVRAAARVLAQHACFAPGLHANACQQDVQQVDGLLHGSFLLISTSICLSRSTGLCRGCGPGHAGVPTSPQLCRLSCHTPWHCTFRSCGTASVAHPP